MRNLGLLLVTSGLAITCCGDGRETTATDPTATAVAPIGNIAVTTTTTQTTTAPPGVQITAPHTTPTTTTTTTTTPPTTDAGQPVGKSVTGNRVILIGDSVMASTASRFWGGMCDVLVPLGWQTEVDAEKSKYIEFATTVLDRRLAAGWDVAVILLGNNYTGDEVAFASQLGTILQRLAPRPTLLLTVSEPGLTGAAVEVNDLIRRMARPFNNVRVVDWAAVTSADPSLLKDRVHLRADGRDALTALIADELGPAPKMPGDCLETEFEFPG